MKSKETVESIMARIWLSRILEKTQFPTVVVCYAAIAFAIFLKFSGGRSEAIISISAFGASMGFISYLMGIYIERTHSQVEEVQRAIEESSRLEKNKSKQAGTSGKIPLTIGFANLVGESMDSTLQEDIKEFSYLFQKSVKAPAHSIPGAEVLFIYANLDKDGAISPEGKSCVRQIVQLTNAAIVVVASPNSPESIKKALELPGQKSANIVFTISRNEKEFGKFFRSLFDKMRSGKDMLSAWVEVAPQVPGGAPSGGPQTLLVAEGGKIAFPRVAGAQQFVRG